MTAGHLVVALDGSGVAVARVGGKAAALDRLVGAGFPVPASFAVTADAYRLFVRRNELGPVLADIESRRGESDGAGESALDDVEQAFIHAPMPDEVAEQVLFFARELGDGPLAVRSSATAEDTRRASFAGQYHSEIGVDPRELLAAVKRVWASLWAPAVVVYRAHQHVGSEGLAMAALVMPMVPAEHAGVAFTVDPGGQTDHVRVELVHGLAEGLVSGKETPEVLVVPRDPPRHLPEGSAEMVDQVVELALAAERLAGSPQDVEWVAVDGEVQLVQARPITVDEPEGPADDDGFDTPALPGVTYTSAGIAEMLPGVLPPLQWTLAGPLIEEAFRELLDDLGVLPAGLTGAHGVVGRFRGRAALNLDLLRDTATRVPGGSATEMERQYFGHVISEGAAEPHDGGDGAPTAGGGRLRSLATLARVLRLYRRAQVDAAVTTNAVELVVSAQVDKTALDDRSLLAYLARLEHLATRVAATQVRVAAGAAATYRGLEILLARSLGPDAEEAARRVTAGALDASAAEIAFPAGEIAVLLDRSGLRELVAERDLPDALSVLGGLEAGREVVERWRHELGRSGSMASFGGPTWGEDPEGAWQAVIGHRGSPLSREGGPDGGGGDALAELEVELTRTWRWRAVRVVTGQIVDIRRRLLHRLANDAGELLAQREATKGGLLLLGGEVRRTTLELGRRLATSGDLPEPDDVVLLGWDELRGLVDRRTLPSRPELERRRKALDTARDEGPLPQSFDDRPGPVRGEEGAEGVLRGWGASSGRYAGNVKVVTEPRRANVNRGDVLVANSTDPSWTPLFLRAGALVVEEGGPLSHAAIIARELGLPAVLNCHGATARLTDGVEVVVDGDTGTVEVVDDREEPDDGPRVPNSEAGADAGAAA